MYSVVSRQWEEKTPPVEQKSTLFSPRGGHSACCIGSQLWVYGGYGGALYSRKDLEDVHVLDLELWKWIKVSPKGRGPGRRSEHSAVAVDSTMFVIGGRSTTTEFKDMYALETEVDPPVWIEVENGTMDVPRWSHATYAVQSVPNWKIFVFGGVGGEITDANRQGTCMNDVAIFDTGMECWMHPDVQGDPPLPRSDTQLEYYHQGGKLVLWGGWANRWFSDGYTLDVGSIVGPPYAIVDVRPDNGPITGESLLEVYGIDFINTEDVTIRFARRKQFVDVKGTFVSQTRITCISPNFTETGIAPGTVDVRVCLAGESFTTTKADFTFFPVTDAKFCFMYGPGLLEEGAPGRETTFVIQARDGDNNNREFGGDEFDVRVFFLMSEDYGEEEPAAGAERDDDESSTGGHGENRSRITVRRNEYCEDGTYIISWIPPAPGDYEICVNFKGTFGGVAGPVRGSPVIAHFETGQPAENNTMSGPAMVAVTEADINALLQFASKASPHAKEGIRRKISKSADQNEVFQDVVSVQRQLLHFHEKKGHMQLLMDRSLAVLAQLRREKLQVAEMEVQASRVVSLMDDLKRIVPEVELQMGPLLKAQAPKLKVDVVDMENFLRSSYDIATTAEYTLWVTGPEVALEMLRIAHEEFDAQRERVKEADALAQIFQISGDLVQSRLLITQVDELYEAYTLLWQEARACSDTIVFSKAIVWKDLIPEGFEDTALELMSKVKKLPKKLHSTDAYKGLYAQAKGFQSTCPLVGSLKRSKLSHRHWEQLLGASDGDTAGFPLQDVEHSLTLKDLLSLDLAEMADDVEAIADRAAKEAHQEAALLVLQNTWARIEFCVTATLQTGTETPLIKMAEEDLEALEADLLIVQSMVASRYTHFKKESLEWQRALSFVGDVMAMLNEIQQMWSYLEPLFIHSEEVKKELPLDTKRFQKIDGEVKAMLTELWAVKKVKAACNKPGLVPKLEIIVVELEKCKKSLSEYLSGKKRLFPRFHFTSEADLLDILSNGNQPAKILRHIDKLMLSTSTLELEAMPGNISDRPRAVRFEAGVGDEIIDFEPAVLLEGKVEAYLQEVLECQKKTLGNTLKRSLQRYPNQARVEWLMNADPPGSINKTDPAQVALLVAGIHYVLEVEATLQRVDGGDSTALGGYHDLQVNQLNQLIELTRSELKRDDRQRIMSLITMDAHARDVVLMLIRENVTDKADFQWASQLKQRFKGESGHSSDPKLPLATVEACDASFEYGFEFLGNGPRLVITPLTDRIYVTATQALQLKMGCAPAGPAGTGKTETTKDLAAALGKCCYVFNCSPEMDYQSLGDIFKGLASSGAWGCFDEFNRLIPEVLSVCSLQFKAVTDGLRAHAVAQVDGSTTDTSRHSIVIEDDRVSLDPGCGVFITMNPGYLGRSELPEGLKVLFRPITVMVPDLVLICENMLMAEGFMRAKALASKFHGLYSLLQELLSKQDHYDWGMRAVKSVLVVAGMLKRAAPALPEDTLLMRALRDFNTPKIVHSDEAVFFGLLNDLFPSINPPRLVNDQLNACVREVSEDMNLWPDDTFVLKVSQLNELLAVRHCNFIVGQAGAGKSSCWKVLKEARNRLDPNNKVKDVDLNPKTVPTEELYGHISLSTREWKDGLLSTIMRDLGAIPNEAPKWIILDGDLDANWIESMNSVMDDNRVLTLASNERIPLRDHMRMIFEIRDLAYATPATVSRAGILYMSTVEGQQWHSLIASWVTGSGYNEVVKAQLSELFELYVPPLVKCVSTQMKTSVECEPTTAVSALLQLLETFLKDHMLSDPSLVEHSFVFCAIWAFGSALGLGDDGIDYRKLFSDWWRREFSRKVKLPARDTIFDYFLSMEDDLQCSFEPWKKHNIFKVIDFDSSKMQMSEVTVPTAETASATFWMEQRMTQGKAVMLVGPAGTGKTQLVMGVLRTLLEQQGSDYLSTKINMNFYTSAAVLQSSMISSLQKKSGSNYGPPASSKMIYFVDDLNLPALDAYNTQSAIALIRQHMDYGHWYAASKLAVQNISDCQYVTAMNPTAGSFQINPRLQRHFLAFAIGMPSPTSLLAIFETFLEGHLRQDHGGKRFQPGVVQVCSSLIKGALSVHKEVSDTFRKTTANFHYEFNMRHLTNVFEGLLKAHPKNFGQGEQLVCLWLHESERVYGDRLVSRQDMNRFRAIMSTQAKKAFPQYNCSRFFLEVSTGNAAAGQPLIFNFTADGEYIQVESIDTLRETLEGTLLEYNASNAVMDLVLFDEACLHVARVSRVLKQAGGHAMLIGVGGSGKQSLAKLAIYMTELIPMTIVISKGYGLNDFKTDLQIMFTKAGVKGQDVGFLFTDNQIVQERFLVYLNDLLSSGHIPDLYTKDEQLSIAEELVEVVKAKGISPEPPACWDYFIQQIREKLHVILCLSPMAPEFRRRARKFPALVSCTVIDWFQPWPKEALASVGTRFLANNEYLSGEGIREGVEKFMINSFEGVNVMCNAFVAAEGRYVYTTPKSYLELLKLFTSLLERKHLEVDAAIQRLEGGVLKLAQSADAVASLEENLKVMLASAEEKRAQADKMAEQVRMEREGVERETENANIEAGKVAIIQNEVSRKQADAENDLAKAEPAVLAATSALDTLDKSQLGQCKTMSVPPPGVVDIFIACMVLLATLSDNVGVSKQTGKVREKDRTWDSVKKSLLGNINGFLEELKEFKGAVDDGSVPEINIREVRPFLDLEHFKVEVIEKRNSAAAGLCSWVLNIVQYYDIVRTVEPKRRALQEANGQLEAANLELGEVRARLAQLEATLAALNAEYEKAEGEKLDAQNTYERGKSKIELARRLVSSLGGETERWAKGVSTLANEKDVLVGDVLVASAFLSYIGPFTKPFREQLLRGQWLPLLEKSVNNKPMPMSAAADPLRVLTSEAEIAKWNTQGLPADPVSAENGAIVNSCARWPLIIDPQLQGIAWLKQKEANRNLQIVRLGQKTLLRRLQEALERGYSMIVENMGESIDPVILPVVTRAFVRRGNRTVIVIGDDEVEQHDDFRFFLHTKLSNPHFPPEVQAETTMVNFMVTPTGLEDQLLSVVIKTERPDLATHKASLLQQQNQFRVRIRELEDDILVRLAESSGDVTEDRALVEGLEESKKLSKGITQQLAEMKVATEKITQLSEEYKDVAKRGSLLYFIITDLHKINSLYVYSLNAFVAIFQCGIDLVNEETAGRKSDKGKSKAVPPKNRQRKRSSQVQPFGWNEDLIQTSAEPAEHSRESIGSLGDLLRHEDGESSGARDELLAKVSRLQARITLVVFNYVRRGLVEKDKLIVASLVALKTMRLCGENSGGRSAIESFLSPQPAGDSSVFPEEARRIFPEHTWKCFLGLEWLGDDDILFQDIAAKFVMFADEWAEWYESPCPEEGSLPGDFAAAGEVQTLCVLRVLRPDRITFALRKFVAAFLGESFVSQPPFSMQSVLNDSSASTPILFLLFPGVDPTAWVEGLGRELGVTTTNGLLSNTSMGQGQEAKAERTLVRLAQKGGWAMLQNVHLMQSWLPTLVVTLESLSDTADESFRCFLSAELPPLPTMQNMPEALLQSCLKVANEAPADLRSNLRRAWAMFDQEKLDSCTAVKEFRACLFGLCFFHSLVLGRRRFGQQGWSRSYGFNNGDLSICANILHSYWEASIAPSGGGIREAPWQELRYIFGEIMYGGHITDYFDRRVTISYLEDIFDEKLVAGKELAPGFLAPEPEGMDHHLYSAHIERFLPEETPAMFGMPANAETGYLTNAAEEIFAAFSRLGTGAGKRASTSEQEEDDTSVATGGGSPICFTTAESIRQGLLPSLPQRFDVNAIGQQVR
ncbi:unnamed protein product, partial [Sphacelaria rigidula]